MKKIILIVLILVVGFSLYGNGNKEKVLLYIRHGPPIYDTDFIAQEVVPMISMLKHAGFKVVVASASAEAGVLVGRKYANWEDQSGKIAYFDGAVYSGDGVVRDGKVITSAYCPFRANACKEQDGTPQLVTLFTEAIKE
jgi:hypothetical protein